VLTWFNDYGSAPQVTHTAGSGVYKVEFPDAPVLGTGGNTVLSVTPDDQPTSLVALVEDCAAVNADYANSGRPRSSS